MHRPVLVQEFSGDLVGIAKVMRTFMHRYVDSFESPVVDLMLTHMAWRVSLNAYMTLQGGRSIRSYYVSDVGDAS